MVIFVIMMMIFFRKEERTSDLHTVPNLGAREGVSLQQIPDEAEEDRDSTRPLSHGKADQNMVPEPEDEVEEGEQDEAGRGGSRRVSRLQLAKFLKD